MRSDGCERGGRIQRGISGQRWTQAAERVGDELGIEIAAHVLGPGPQHADLFDDWARLREVSEKAASRSADDPAADRRLIGQG